MADCKRYHFVQYFISFSNLAHKVRLEVALFVKSSILRFESSQHRQSCNSDYYCQSIGIKSNLILICWCEQRIEFQGIENRPNTLNPEQKISLFWLWTKTINWNIKFTVKFPNASLESWTPYKPVIYCRPAFHAFQWENIYRRDDGCTSLSGVLLFYFVKKGGVNMGFLPWEALPHRSLSVEMVCREQQTRVQWLPLYLALYWHPALQWNVILTMKVRDWTRG